jgi:hypothetical protein
VREHDPRGVIRRRRQARARVRILDVPQSGSAPDGSVTTEQAAEVTLPRAELERIWTPEYLERLARTYWRFLTRVSLGLLRVLYTPESREVVLLTRPFVLLRFFAPEYEIRDDRGAVTWRIERGLLVAPAGRGKGYLRISVSRPAGDDDGDTMATVRVGSIVASFYPSIRGWGWFSRIGKRLYQLTQLQIHVIVTHAFLRSLARLDLAPSVVGALLPREEAPQNDGGAPKRPSETSARES